MKIKNLFSNDSWAIVKDLALNTIGLNNKKNKEPDSEWRRRILLSEHSPIRYLTIRWTWENLKSFVSVHFVRHKIGIEHYVKTQRSDRTNVDRNKKPQDSPVNHTVVANAQAIITVSRKRLCSCASIETREAWKAVLVELEKTEPELVRCCVKECVYRGFCPEYFSCYHHLTPVFQNELAHYREGINVSKPEV